MDSGEFDAGGSPAMDYHPIHGVGESRNTPSRFILRQFRQHADEDRPK